MHIFHIWSITMQSLNKKEWKLLELQITQTRRPKVLQVDGQMDRADPLLDLLSLKRSTQVKKIHWDVKNQIKQTKKHIVLWNKIYAIIYSGIRIWAAYSLCFYVQCIYFEDNLFLSPIENDCMVHKHFMGQTLRTLKCTVFPVFKQHSLCK